MGLLLARSVWWRTSIPHVGQSLNKKVYGSEFNDLFFIKDKRAVLLYADKWIVARLHPHARRGASIQVVNASRMCSNIWVWRFLRIFRINHISRS